MAENPSCKHLSESLNWAAELDKSSDPHLISFLCMNPYFYPQTEFPQAGNLGRSNVQSTNLEQKLG